VDEEDKTDGVTIRDAIGRGQNPVLINESGLYFLILSSKLPTAKQFKRWVTSEVLPSIRKTGGYIAGQEALSDSDLMAKALLVANRQLEERAKRVAELEAKAEQDKPKVLFADSVAASKTSVLVGDLAKLIRQNGVETGQQRLFATLRRDGFLMKSGTSYNLPTQRAMEMGLFEVKETTITHADGHITVNRTTKVTGKGQVYFVNRYKKQEENKNETE
jgi:anti-repressor protein